MEQYDSKKNPIGGLLLGILGGLLAVAIIDSLSGPKCPVCGAKVPKGSTACQNCNNWLLWD